MKINEVIRKYRKEQNLTQEQVAHYLGVTAPAVNKWENGISYPDITLLSPLARILKINLDTLLSFHEELTDAEISVIVKEIIELMKKNGYESGFERGENLIREYPNCHNLILSLAGILNAYRSILSVERNEKYEAKIISWYEMEASSDDSEAANTAIASLGHIYIAKKEYNKAQNLLDKIPQPGYDKRMLQAILYASQDNNQAAYEIYEKMLYKAANEICSILQLIIHLQCKEEKMDYALTYAEVAKQAAELFDLGSYVAYTPKMFVKIQTKNKEESIELLEQMIDGIDTIGDFKTSPLYSHMKFNEVGNRKEMIELIKKALENDEELDFLREEIGFKRILKRLKE
ncbi:helix-turn-helix domain-containing protein [Anaeromicropila populeti]|uniref:Putative transcriptional regulator n=1 Tax=Anaeromicropila populeti TaxID=37658 RepID=A0A1I6KXP3_9FIRM|nr:helix-turn-helix domain-containing protein [Anaeromicropila populeti]SFR96013.1 putative transcriptional regulator [Anaeromicropila populeti]